MDDEQSRRQGVALAAAAFLMWGVLPIYFKWLSDISSFEVVAHRALWSFLFGALLLIASGQLQRMLAVAVNPRLMA